MTINVKAKTKDGQCEAMRCTSPKTTEAQHPILGRPVNVCAKHARELGIVDAVAVVDVPPEVATIEKASIELAEGAEFLIADIGGQSDLDLAAEVLAEVKGQAKRLEAVKRSILAPLKESEKRLRDLFRPAETRFADIEAKIKAAIAAFHLATEQRNAAAVASIAAGEDATAALASMGSVSNTTGVGVRMAWDFEIVNEAEIPRSLCSPDPTKIREFIKDSGELLEDGLVFDGIRFFQRAIVSSRST